MTMDKLRSMISQKKQKLQRLQEDIEVLERQLERLENQQLKGLLEETNMTLEELMNFMGKQRSEATFPEMQEDTSCA